MTAETTLREDLLDVRSAARRIGVHEETLYKLIRAGEFPPAIHIGRKVLVSARRLDRYLHGEAQTDGAA
jgi:excisionase family DNA binding protein